PSPTSLHDALPTSLGQPQPPHAMSQPRGPQANLRKLQAIAHFHQAVFVRNLHVGKAQFAVPAMLFRPHDGYAPDDFPTGVVFMKEESAKPLASVVGSACTKNRVPCCAGAGNKVLGAIDHPMIAAAL